MKKETQVDGLNKTTFVKEELENGGLKNKTNGQLMMKERKGKLMKHLQ